MRIASVLACLTVRTSQPSRLLASAGLLAISAWIQASCHLSGAAPKLPMAPCPGSASPVGTFAPPQAERLALLRADALLAQESVSTRDADLIIEALDRTRTTRPSLAFDCERAAAHLLSATNRPLASASRWRQAAKAAPLAEHAAYAERFAALKAGAAGQRTRLVFGNERWPLQLLTLEQWAPATLAWAEQAPNDADTARAVALVAAFGSSEDQKKARALQQVRPLGLSQLSESDRTAFVAIVLRCRGAAAANEALSMARAASPTPQAMEWLRLTAEIASRQRRYDDALATWSSLIRRGSPTEQARALGRVGQVFETQERFSEAAMAFRQASGLASHEAEREEWLYATGVMHVWAGEMSQALGAFERYKNAQTNERHATSVLWFSAWAAFRLFDVEHALGLLRELADSGDTTLVPQAEYWLGRIYASLGHSEKSTGWFRKAAGHARSYYATLAQGRLPNASVRTKPKSVPSPVGTDALAWRSPLGQRLLALQELGMLERALGDVAHLAAAPGLSSAMASLSRAELFWRHGDASMAARHAEEALRLASQGPLPPLWAARAESLAYPQVERDAVVHAASGQALSPLLLWAVMRQESRFAADAVSTSGALGLMQLLPTTANRIAQRLPEAAPSAAQLMQPARNIAYGAWYLRGLLSDLRGSVPLAVASYNAGPHARDRWLAAHRTDELDIVVESIPKAETRRYTKLVLQNLAMYARLYEDRQLHIDTKIPASIAHTIDF